MSDERRESVLFGPGWLIVAFILGSTVMAWVEILWVDPIQRRIAEQDGRLFAHIEAARGLARAELQQGENGEMRWVIVEAKSDDD